MFFIMPALTTQCLAPTGKIIEGVFIDTAFTKHSSLPEITLWNGDYLILSNKAQNEFGGLTLHSLSKSA